jgi:carbamoyltransferase
MQVAADYNQRAMYILGISAYYHDSAAALLKDGEIVAAAQQERFSRKKHDAGFLDAAIRWCLEEASIRLTHIDHIAFYDKPLIKFERLLETYLAYAPKGFSSFAAAILVLLLLGTLIVLAQGSAMAPFIIITLF